MPRHDIRWAAGLFEGEGCIYIEKPSSSGRRGVRLVLSSTDRDVLETLQEVMGCGAIYAHKGKAVDLRRRTRKHRQLYAWRAGAADEVEHLLTRMAPYLHERRAAKCREALEVLQWH